MQTEIANPREGMLFTEEMDRDNPHYLRKGHVSLLSDASIGQAMRPFTKPCLPLSAHMLLSQIAMSCPLPKAMEVIRHVI